MAPDDGTTDIDDSSDTSLPQLNPDEPDDGPTIEEAKAAAEAFPDLTPAGAHLLPPDVKTGDPALYD